MNEKQIKYLDDWTELWRKVDLAYTQLVKHFNISGNTYCVLHLLLSKPEGVEPAEIADIVIITRQMVALILNDLEKRGWIIRTGLKTDHRRKKITLTQTGKEFAEKVVNTSQEAELRGFEVMSEEEQALFFSLGSRYCEFLQKEVDRITSQS